MLLPIFFFNHESYPKAFSLYPKILGIPGENQIEWSVLTGKSRKKRTTFSDGPKYLVRPVHPKFADFQYYFTTSQRFHVAVHATNAMSVVLPPRI